MGEHTGHGADRVTRRNCTLAQPASQRAAGGQAQAKQQAQRRKHIEMTSRPNYPAEHKISGDCPHLRASLEHPLVCQAYLPLPINVNIIFCQ